MTVSSSSWRLTYTGAPIDRAGFMRASSDELSVLTQDPSARIIPIWNGNHLFDPDSGEASALSFAMTEGLADVEVSIVFLGIASDTPWFALSLAGEIAPEALADFGVFEPLHPRVGALDSDQAALLAYARGMVLWHRNHLYCGRCGAPAESRDGGHIRQCTSPSCNYRAFPRTDAAVITLVEHPDGNHCLLGRQSRWPEGMYSVVAGFVEPGESLEECVAREVKEETGIVVRDVKYHASQPWPFPSSLMLGFSAKATTTEFKPDDDELIDIQWVSRAALEGYGEMGDETLGPKLPNRHSIARMLIEDWRSQT